MPTDMVTCTNCGKTFSVGVPRGKRIKNYDDAGFWTGPAIIFDIHFKCPKCGRKMGAELEDFCCKRDY
jgi:transcription elongation factor Elf1